MAYRGTSNAPNTRNPDRPPSHPARLDQFGDDKQRATSAKSDVETAEELGVTSNKERRSLRKSGTANPE